MTDSDERRHRRLQLLSRLQWAGLPREALEAQVALRQAYLERLRGKVYGTGFEEEIDLLYQQLYPSQARVRHRSK